MPKTTEERAGRKLWDREAWQGTKFFLTYIRPHKWIFIAALIALAISGAMTFWFFKLMFEFVGRVLNGVNSEGMLEDSTRTTVILIKVAAALAFLAFWRIWLFAKVSERALATLRRDLFCRIIRLPMATLNRHRIGELGSRLSNDVETLRETLVSTIPQLIRHSVLLVFSVGAVLYVSVKLSLFMLACIPVVIVLIAIFGSRIRRLTRRAQDDLAASQVVVDESLQSIVSVKAFANERHEMERYERNISRFLDTAIHASLPRASFVAFIIFSFSTALTLVIWYAARMVHAGEIDHGMLMMFGGFSGIVAQSVMTFGELVTQIQRALGATDRVREILAEEMEPEPTAQVERLRGEIEMRSVRFAYPSRSEVTVLTDFSFKAAAGQRIALVGPSGAGKSTVVSLLLRFYDPIEGEILIDGKPSHQMPLSSLRKNFALVPQEVLLFGGTIRENIAYGRPGATEEEVIRAAKLANAEQFIDKLPDAYDTLVGERGTQLSGGQRQRIAIARAILADPAILILDEATSSLDAESERLVQDALDKLMANRTSIIIAHRLSTVRRADQILVLSAGTIIERGTHDELVAIDHSLYATLAKLQLE
ncbi:MAG: ATP-binding cassette domain-containing protein [Verrucomicrobiaceae bacterium]|nr:ATP-binding cassette domain-containing protein [Verrucomicrobiaceae bacterium]